MKIFHLILQGFLNKVEHISNKYDRWVYNQEVQTMEIAQLTSLECISHSQVRITVFTLTYTWNTEGSLLCKDRQKMLIWKAMLNHVCHPQIEGFIQNHLKFLLWLSKVNEKFSWQ